jgi:hypothetical protein
MRTHAQTHIHTRSMHTHTHTREHAHLTQIPKTVHPERMQENADIFDWSLSQEDFKLLHSMPTQVRRVNLYVCPVSATCGVKQVGTCTLGRRCRKAYVLFLCGMCAAHEQFHPEARRHQHQGEANLAVLLDSSCCGIIRLNRDGKTHVQQNLNCWRCCISLIDITWSPSGTFLWNIRECLFCSL